MTDSLFRTTLRGWMDDLGFDPDAAALVLHVSPRSIYRWLDGSVTPSNLQMTLAAMALVADSRRAFEEAT